MANEPVYVTFEFRGNLNEEVNKVTLGIQGLSNESAKTYQRLIADSSTAFNAMSEGNRKLAVAVQENINELRNLAVVQKALDDEMQAGTITTQNYTQSKAALAAEESTLRAAITSGMQALNARQQTESEAVGSIASLTKKLRELTESYHNLSKADREGAAGQGMLTQIQSLDKEIGTAHTRLSQYSRTAGTGFNGLSMSVQQVARELPSLTMGANMFFLAISNNLPILADNLKAARVQNELLKKSNQATVPVWRQVLSSLVSWQTALVVGVTLLSVYGKDIWNWTKSLFGAKNALDKTVESLEAFRQKVSQSVAKSIVEFKRMAAEWAVLGDDMAARKKYFLENADAIRQMNVAVTDATDADKLFTAGKQAFIDSLFERAKAAAAMELAADKYKSAIEKMMEAESASAKEVTFADSAKSAAAMGYAAISAGTATGTKLSELTPEAFRDARLEKLRTDKKKYFTEADTFLKQAISYGEKEQDILTAAGLKSTDELVANSVGAIKKAISLKRESLEKLTNKKDYNKVAAEIKAEEKKLEAVTGNKKKEDKQQTKEQKAQEAANILRAETAMRELEIERQQDALAQKEKDAGLDLRQQKLDLQKESTDKELEQIALDYDRKINEIEKKGREYILAQQKIEQVQWENANPDWKKKGLEFKPSTITTDQLPASQRDELSTATTTADGAREKAEADLLEKTLKQYQDYAAKRLAVEKQYNDDIAYLLSQRTDANKAAIDAAVAEAADGKKKALSELSLDELKDTDMWSKMFGDLDKMALPSLEGLLKQAKEVNTSAWNPENIKEYEDAITRLEEAVRSRSPFKAIGEDWNKLLKGFKTGNKDDVAAAFAGIDTAVQKINADLGTIAGGIGDIFGEEAGYAAEQVVGLTSAIGGFATAASKIASGDILGGITVVVSSVASIFSMGKKVKDMNAAARAEVQEYYDTALDGEREYLAMLRERQRTQQEIGESTLAYNKRINAELAKQQQDTSAEQARLMAQLQGEQYVSGKGYKHGTWFRKAKTWDEYSSLAGKSYEDIEKLYSEGKLDEKVSKLFEQLRALKEEGGDINQMLADQDEAMREAMTGTTTDSIADSILQGFAQGKRSAADFADDFQAMLNNAVLQGIKMKALEEPLRKWYESFAVASGNGLTEESIADLKAQYDKIIADAAKQLEDMEAVTGMPIGAEAGRQAVAKGIGASITQDSVNELNGNFSAMLIYLDKTNTTVTNINTLLVEGLSVLNRIAVNTDRLEAIENHMKTMNGNLLQMLNKGLIMRKMA